MTCSSRLLVISLLTVLLCARAVEARLTAQLAYPDAPRPGHFESILLKVSTLPTGFRGKTLRLQDARGGLYFGRAIDAWTGGSASPDQTIMLPLPMIAATDLPQDRWPLIVTLIAADGTETRENIDLPLPPIGAAGGAQRVLIVSAGGRGVAPEESPATTRADATPPILPRPTVTARMSEAEFSQTPALALVGFDLVELDAHAAAAISQDQAAALLNVGLRIRVRQDDAPAGGLGRFVWDRLAAGDPSGPGWITPRTPLPAPRLIEPALLDARSLHVQAKVSSGLRRILLAVAPAAILLVVLTRMMIRRRTALLATLTACLIVWTALAIALAATYARPARSIAQWLTRSPAPLEGGPAGPGGEALALHESFAASSSLIARDLDITGLPGEMIWPAAITPRQYFAFEHAALNLQDIAGGRGAVRLTMHVPPRTCLIIARRSVQPATLIPAYPGATQGLPRWAADARIDLAHAWQLDAGYVTPAADTQASPQVFPQWVDQTARGAGLGPAAETWFALRFDARHRYLMAAPTVPAGTPTEMLILDCGPLPLSGRAPPPGSGPGS